MKNITVSVDDATLPACPYSRVGARHARIGSSAGLLVDLGRQASREALMETAAERRGRLMDWVMASFDARGVGLDPRDSLPREDLCDRARARAEVAEAAPRP